MGLANSKFKLLHQSASILPDQLDLHSIWWDTEGLVT